VIIDRPAMTNNPGMRDPNGRSQPKRTGYEHLAGPSGTPGSLASGRGAVSATILLYARQNLPDALEGLGAALTRPMTPSLAKIMQSMVLEQPLEARRINIRP